jgi:hypothetical protein
MQVLDGGEDVCGVDWHIPEGFGQIDKCESHS